MKKLKLQQKIISIIIIIMLIFNTTIKAFAFVPAVPVITWTIEEIIATGLAIIGAVTTGAIVEENSDEIMDTFQAKCEAEGIIQEKVNEWLLDAGRGIIHTKDKCWQAFVETIQEFKMKLKAPAPAGNYYDFAVGQQWGSSSAQYYERIDSITLITGVYVITVKSASGKGGSRMFFSANPFTFDSTNCRLNGDVIQKNSTRKANSLSNHYGVNCYAYTGTYTSDMVLNGATQEWNYTSDQTEEIKATMEKLLGITTGEVETFDIVDVGYNVTDEQGQTIPTTIINNSYAGDIYINDVAGLSGTGTLQGTLDGIREGTITYPQVLNATNTSVVTGDVATDTTLNKVIDNAVSDEIVNNPNIPTDTGNVNGYVIRGLNEIFPFCIPFDIYHLLKAFVKEPKAPHFAGSLHLLNKDYPIEIDLSKFDSVAELLRNMECLLYIVGLAVVTRKMIGG